MVSVLAVVCFAASTVAAQERTPPAPKALKLALGAYITAQAVDLAARERIIAQGGRVRNPILGYSMSDPALTTITKVGTTALTTWALMKLASRGPDGRRHTKLITGVAIGLAAGTAVTAARSYRESRRE
jgi:hypothetical protein